MRKHKEYVTCKEKDTYRYATLTPKQKYEVLGEGAITYTIKDDLGIIRDYCKDRFEKKS